MTWTGDDQGDVEHALERARRLVKALEMDTTIGRARPATRLEIDAVFEALLALDDVYFESDDGKPLPEVWRRARLTVGKR